MQMNNVVVSNNRILPSNEKSVKSVQLLTEAIEKNFPIAEIDTHHIIHGGMYSRTIKLPAKTVLAGALLKVGTILIINGDVLVYTDDKAIELNGYNVFAASSNRKQAFYAITETYMTTVFPTKAKTISEAEEEFTDEASLLLSRKQVKNNIITITGE